MIAKKKEEERKKKEAKNTIKAKPIHKESCSACRKIFRAFSIVSLDLAPLNFNQSMTFTTRRAILMSIFYFIHATSALFRLIIQTSAHPRTAILVSTISKAADDLWHWIILFLMVNFGFIMLGIAQFGSDKEEFSSILTSFETLWEMLLGSMLESGDIPSSTWSSNWLIMTYLLLYNFLVFMIM